MFKTHSYTKVKITLIWVPINHSVYNWNGNCKTKCKNPSTVWQTLSLERLLLGDVTPLTIESSFPTCWGRPSPKRQCRFLNCNPLVHGFTPKVLRDCYRDWNRNFLTKQTQKLERPGVGKIIRESDRSRNGREIDVLLSVKCTTVPPGDRKYKQKVNSWLEETKKWWKEVP